MFSESCQICIMEHPEKRFRLCFLGDPRDCYYCGHTTKGHEAAKELELDRLGLSGMYFSEQRPEDMVANTIYPPSYARMKCRELEVTT